MNESQILAKIVEVHQRRFDRADRLRNSKAESDDEVDVLELALLQARLELVRYQSGKCSGSSSA